MQGHVKHVRLRTGRESARAGYSLIEIVIAIVVLTIAVGSISTSLVSTTSLSRSNEERTLALDTALSVIEAIRAEDPAEVFVRYNQTTADDPATGPSPGGFFSVPGLTVRPGDPDGFVGEVQFPGDGVTLREDVGDIELGMPRDLNADAVLDSVDHAADYTVLPVRVRIEWAGTSGLKRVEMYTQIGLL